MLVDLQPQPNGHYTLAAAMISVTNEFDELDIGGELQRRWSALGGYGTDSHELRLVGPGSGILLGTDTATMDLSLYGGSSTARVAGNVLERVDATGRLLFLWNAFDHFSITDIDPSIPLNTAVIDWTHSNAIEIDRDGNYLMSSRNLSEITKIDSRTGSVVWRWGGVRNEFRFTNDTLMFSFQHGIRRLANGNYVLFDNGNTHNPHFSRAVEYSLDEGAKTATVVWSYRPNPDIFSGFLGFTQRLANGNTLVTFGPQGTAHEVSPSGQLVWKLSVAGNIYRAYRIRSLYEPYLVDESPVP